MTKLDRIKLADPGPRGLPAADIDAILAAIPKASQRDRLLFRFIYLTGVRVSEALQVHVEDLDLTVDDEHVTVTGKGGRRRTLLLDDRALVTDLRRYLKARRYQHGPIFRAAKNGTGQPLRYQSVHQLWQKYTRAAASPRPCTSSGTVTPPSSSTMASRCRPSANGSATATCRPPCGTPNSQISPPTTSSAPGSAAAPPVPAGSTCHLWRRGPAVSPGRSNS